MTISAFSRKDQKTKNRYEVIPGDCFFAVRTVRPTRNLFSFWQAADYDIKETANTKPEDKNY